MLCHTSSFEANHSLGNVKTKSWHALVWNHQLGGKELDIANPQLGPQGLWLCGQFSGRYDYSLKGNRSPTNHPSWKSFKHEMSAGIQGTSCYLSPIPRFRTSSHKWDISETKMVKFWIGGWDTLPIFPLNQQVATTTATETVHKHVGRKWKHMLTRLLGLEWEQKQ